MTRPLPDGRWVLAGNAAASLDGHLPHAPPEVSVVVPYYCDQARLDLVLTGLALQTHPSSRLEVVVADDGSPVAPTVSPHAAGLDVRVVRQDDRGFRAAAARNLGLAVAGGSVVCFLDGDTVPEPDYVTRLVRLPTLAPDAVVTGRRRHADLTGWTADRLRAWLTGAGPAPIELDEPAWLAELSTALPHLDDGSYRAVISAVLAGSRELFVEVGGFDPDFTAYGGEDWELAHRLVCAGAVLAHERSAVAWHDGPDWAGRSEDPVAAAAQKADETRALDERIPAGRRGAAWFPRPDTVVRVHHRHAATAASVLDVPDVGVWTGGVDLGWTDVRVRAGVPPPDVLSRCRAVVDLHRPTDLAPVLARVRPGGVGEVRAGGVLVRSRRAWARAHRWAGVLGVDEDTLVAELFGAG